MRDIKRKYNETNKEIVTQLRSPREQFFQHEPLPDRGIELGQSFSDAKDPNSTSKSDHKSVSLPDNQPRNATPPIQITLKQSEPFTPLKTSRPTLKQTLLQRKKLRRRALEGNPNWETHKTNTTTIEMKKTAIMIAMNWIHDRRIDEGPEGARLSVQAGELR